MKKLVSIFAFVVLLSPLSSFAGPHYLGGNIKNITTNTQGMLIMLDSGVPDNCAGTASGWMQINKEDSTMTALVLAMWANGKRTATIYTNAKPADKSFCVVNQVDPAG